MTATRIESPGFFASAARGLVSGIFMLGGLALLLCALGIVAVDGMNRVYGVAFMDLEKVRFYLRWAGLIGGTWGAMSGMVAGVVARPRRIWSRGIVPRTTRAAVGWILGGTLGAAATYFYLSPDASAIRGAMVGAAVGGLAGAILTARSFQPPVYQAAPRRGGSEIGFVAKGIVAVFAVVLVVKFLLIDLIPYAILLVVAIGVILILYRIARARKN